jgi:hypothetical protein
MRPIWLLMVCAAATLVACGGEAPSSGADEAAEATRPGVVRTPPPEVTASDLDATPISAADYSFYAAIMGGASALLADLGPDDRAALELEREVKAGRVKPSPANEAPLARARELHRKDVELARLQGVEARYLAVKQRVEAAIGPRAQAPAANDRVGQENLRYLEAHRANIERLQRILDDPLARDSSSAETGSGSSDRER